MCLAKFFFSENITLKIPYTGCPKKSLLNPEYQVSQVDLGALKAATKTRLMGLKIFRNILHVSKNITILSDQNTFWNMAKIQNFEKIQNYEKMGDKKLKPESG